MMRIVVANDGLGDAGGVHTYLAAVVPALRARGHDVALLHLAGEAGPEGVPGGDDLPRFQVDAADAQSALRALEWKPDVVFSHNMRVLDVDRVLSERVPVVKMMHGYFGTCVSGLKMHLFPRAVPCSRPLGPGCIPIYATRRCGPMNPLRIATSYRWAQRQNALFAAYAGIVVASRHMQREYVANGAAPERVHCLPLFAPPVTPSPRPAHAPLELLFLGRMTPLKGGDVLLRAIAAASTTAAPIRVTMAGDGPARADWEALARALHVDAHFTGWVDAAQRAGLFARAALLAVPSVWPEPFGLVGLEAAAAGVPAIGFDNGGIGEWLRDGENGWLVPGPPAAASLADALVRVSADASALRQRGAGAVRAAQHFTLARHVGRLETVLAAAMTAPAAVR